jgi:undecaprenyl-diphosphatase
MSYLQAIILAIIEGITEFLPVSSTGHMIIASSAMGIAHDPFTKLFTITIQFGAILSVIVLYWKRFFPETFRGLYPRSCFWGFVRR